MWKHLIPEVATIVIRERWLRSTGWIVWDATGCYSPKSVQNKHCFQILVPSQHQQDSTGLCNSPVGGEMVHNLNLHLKIPMLCF